MVISILAASAAADSAESCHASLGGSADIACIDAENRAQTIHEKPQGSIAGNVLLQTNTVRAHASMQKQAQPLELLEDPGQLEDVGLAQEEEDGSNRRRRRRRRRTNAATKSPSKPAETVQASSGLSCTTSAYENADFSKGAAGTCTGCLVPTSNGQGLPLCFYRNDQYAKQACSASEGKVYCGDHVPVAQPMPAAKETVAPPTPAPAVATVAAATTAKPESITTPTIPTTTSTTTTTTTTTQSAYECIAPPGKSFEAAKEICPTQNEYWCKIKGPSCEWKLRSAQFQASVSNEDGACSSTKGTSWSEYCAKSEAKTQCEERYAGESKCFWTPGTTPAPTAPAGADVASSCEDEAAFKNSWGWSCATLGAAAWAKSIRDAKCTASQYADFGEHCRKTCNRC